MSTFNFDNQTILTSNDQLVSYFRDAEKPEENWKIGVEHEKFIVDTTSQRPLPFDGEKSISALFKMLQERDWQPIYDQTNIIGLQKKNTIISLEPGGQLELSGAPHRHLFDIEKELYEHLEELKILLPLLNAEILWLGIHPFAKREDMAKVPKTRYGLMKKYMPEKGDLGLDMMLRTSSIQVNLDFSSEKDMVQKFQIATGLTPFVIAHFANSKMFEGKDTGFCSYRTHIWQDTDKDRCGLLPFVLDSDFGYQSYIHYALNVPMYFIMRDGHYIDALGIPFIDFLEKRAEKLKDYTPIMGDWENHLTTLFPEIRLKTYIECRMMDSGKPERIIEAGQFWERAFYDKENRDSLHGLIMSWPKDDIMKAYELVPKMGFETPFLRGKLGDYKKQIFA